MYCMFYQYLYCIKIDTYSKTFTIFVSVTLFVVLYQKNKDFQKLYSKVSIKVIVKTASGLGLRVWSNTK